MKKILLTIILTVFLIPSFAHADITTSLQGWWKLDDGSGTSAADSSGNANTGTLSNTPTWVTGKIGPFALSFVTASSQSVDAGNGASLNITSAGTVSAWVKFSGQATYVGIACKDDLVNDRNGYCLFITSGNAAGLEIASGSGFNENDHPTNLSDNAWHMITGTWDGTNVKVYVDGGSVNSIAQTITPVSNVNNMALARIPGQTGHFFNGSIDEVRVYSRALTASDITELYAYTGVTTTFRRFFFNARMRLFGIFKFK